MTEKANQPAPRVGGVLEVAIGVTHDHDSDDGLDDAALAAEFDALDPRDTDPALVARVKANAAQAADAAWRRLATTRLAEGTLSLGPQATAPKPGRGELLARLDVLSRRYPNLVAQHRGLTGKTDETLQAMVEDIEALTGDCD